MDSHLPYDYDRSMGAARSPQIVPYMDTHLPYDYDSDDFVGREDIVQDIIEMLCGSRENIRSRSFLVDGPAKRGKTWLMRRVEEKLRNGTIAVVNNVPQSNHPTQTAVCFFEGRIFANERSYSEELKCKLLSHLWIIAHDHISDLPTLFDLAQEDTYEQKCEKIRLRFFKFEISSLLTEIKTHIKEPILFIIIVDGMNEIDVGVLRLFEREFIAPLFRNTQIRLLASRRIDSIEHKWREPIIRLQLDRPLTLEWFNDTECQKQIEHLLAQKSSILSPDDLRQQMKTPYSWGNPGANAFLVERAIQNSNRQQDADRATALVSHIILISDDDIRDCLKYLMSSLRDPAPIDSVSFERVGRMIADFPEIATKGAPRHRLNQILGGISDSARDEFLGRLQDRGVGAFGTSGNYIIHADFVELFRELRARMEP
jgi:hypothetical protein